MQITVIGTGFIGSILGGALARSGHEVTFGSRHPDDEVPSVSSKRRLVGTVAPLARTRRSTSSLRAACYIPARQQTEPRPRRCDSDCPRPALAGLCCGAGHPYIDGVSDSPFRDDRAALQSVIEELRCEKPPSIADT